MHLMNFTHKGYPARRAGRVSCKEACPIVVSLPALGSRHDGHGCGRLDCVSGRCDHPQGSVDAKEGVLRGEHLLLGDSVGALHGSACAMFVAVPHAISGTVEWRSQPIPSLDSPEGWELIKGEFLSATYSDMLNDDERNEKYESTIRTVLDHAKKNGIVNVVDIGSGTGLLALLSVRHGAQQVYAFEVVPSMAAICKVVVDANDATDKVNIIQAHSTSITPEWRANVLVTEIFDSELLGEGILPTLRHGIAHLLHDRFTIIPGRARVIAQVTTRTERKHTFSLRCSIPNPRLTICTSFLFLQAVECYHLRDWCKLERLHIACCGCQACPSIPLRVDGLGKSLNRLSDPFEALQFDFRDPPPEGTHRKVQGRRIFIFECL